MSVFFVLSFKFQVCAHTHNSVVDDRLFTVGDIVEKIFVVIIVGCGRRDEEGERPQITLMAFIEKKNWIEDKIQSGFMGFNEGN